MEETIEIYQSSLAAEMSGKISDIENSIHASLLVNQSYENNKCIINTPFKILITFSFLGLIFFIGIVVGLFLKKEM